MTQNKYFGLNLRDSKFGPKNAEQNNRGKTIFLKTTTKILFFLNHPLICIL